MRAGVADSVAGGSSVDATEITIGGTTVIDTDGMLAWANIKGVPANLIDLSCTDDQIALRVSGAWACADGNGHNHAAEQITSGILSISQIPVGLSDQHWRLL